MSGSSFTDIFGGTTVRPSAPNYIALTISADTALYWPLETTQSVPVVAAAMDITATTTSLTLNMPPGNTGSTGVICYITNVGSNEFQVMATDGTTAIATIATTETWLLILSNNSTTNGTWRALQIASTTSSATAASLAGQGLEANGSLLQTDFPITSLSGNTSLTAAYRGESVVWTGAAGTLQLDNAATLGNGWFCLVSNRGSDVLTISTTSSELINGSVTLSMYPGNSGIIVASATAFTTFGVLADALAVVNGGTGARTADQALTNLGGTSTGKSIFTAPNAAAVVALLGLNNIQWLESTVSTNQIVTAGNSRTIYVATSPINITLPLASTLTTAFALQIYAEGGAVTVIPNVADSINGFSPGATFTIPSGGNGQFVTDGVNDWWVLFGPQMSGTRLDVTFDINAGGTIAATGAIVSASTLSGAAITSAGTITAGTSLKSTTSTTVGTTLTVGGAATLNGAAVFNNTATFAAATTFNNITSFGTTATFLGLVDCSFDLEVNQDFYLQKAANVTHTASGGGDSLPANPAGFVTVYINGTQQKIPFYGM